MKNILFLGLISFFADISTEMVYPLIPLYLTHVFGATPALIGAIEGIAESIASLLKVFSGYITDKYKNKKPVAFIGYATGLVYKFALILASTWVGILLARVIDRLGKGIRTAPRDALVCESSDKNSMGKAFGIHKALDMAGSALGILLAYFFLKTIQDTNSYEKLFLISVIPAVLGLFMFIFVKERKVCCEMNERIPFWKNSKLLNSELKLYLVVAFIFTLGNSSNAFLLLKAKSVGFDDKTVVLLYFIYNLSASLLSIPFGKLSDKIGRKRVLVCGYLAFSLVYLGFALTIGKAFLVAVFILYGAYTAMIAGVERAFISEISPQNLKGTMLGLHSTVVGIALLPASMIAGFLWNYFGDVVPFLFGSFMALLAALILLFKLKEAKR